MNKALPYFLFNSSLFVGVMVAFSHNPEPLGAITATLMLGGVVDAVRDIGRFAAPETTASTGSAT